MSLLHFGTIASMPHASKKASGYLHASLEAMRMKWTTLFGAIFGPDELCADQTAWCTAQLKELDVEVVYPDFVELQDVEREWQALQTIEKHFTRKAQEILYDEKGKPSSHFMVAEAKALVEDVFGDDLIGQKKFVKADFFDSIITYFGVMAPIFFICVRYELNVRKNCYLTWEFKVSVFLF